MKSTFKIPVHSPASNIPPPKAIAEAGEQVSVGFGDNVSPPKSGELAALGFGDAVDLGSIVAPAAAVESPSSTPTLTAQQPSAQQPTPQQPTQQPIALPPPIDLSPLISRLATVEANLANFQIEAADAFTKAREALTKVEQRGLVKPVDLTDIYAGLDSVNASLDTLAKASGVKLSPPTIRLRQHRHLNAPAKVEGGFVILHYSPRPDEPAEIQLRLEPRQIWVGYSFEIPEGYVADVWSAGRCVSSFAGSSGEHEARLPVIGTSNMGQVIPTGREILRLSLRRIEPVSMTVERVTV